MNNFNIHSGLCVLQNGPKCTWLLVVSYVAVDRYFIDPRVCHCAYN